MSQDEFRANEMVQSAVIREFQVIGEAARMISDETKATHTAISWDMISGMRNRLIHEYFAIRLDVVWQTLLEDIPPLIVELEKSIPPDNKDEE